MTLSKKAPPCQWGTYGSISADPGVSGARIKQLEDGLRDILDLCNGLSIFDEIDQIKRIAERLLKGDSQSAG